MEEIGIQLLTAFGGGILGAAVGGLPAFILCGIAALGGSLIYAATGSAAFLITAAWGPFLGPHVTFSGAVAAAAFAAGRGRLDSGRNILVPLAGFNSPSILLIGGGFGILGFLCKTGLDLIPSFRETPRINSIALAIIVTGVLTRFLFGKSGLFGRPASRWSAGHDAAHFPWHVPPLQLLLLASAYGLPAVYAAKYLPEAPGLIFALATISLIFLQNGAKVPVAHHIVLSAEIAVLAGGGIWWGITLAILAAVLGEFFAGLFLIHADTHIDPPAAALGITYSLVPLLAASGWLAHSGPLPVLSILALTSLGYILLYQLRKRAEDKTELTEKNTR